MLQVRIRGDFSCGKCKTRRYCSKSHQKLDWSLHKGSCGRVVEDVMNDTASKIGTNVLFPDLGVDVVSEELEKTIDDIDKYNIWEDAGMIAALVCINLMKILMQ